MTDRRLDLYHGDCRDVLGTLLDASIDAVVTDPPAGIAFMNAHWDRFDRQGFISFMTDVMADLLRVLKPGGHALVWALPRTSHWTATAIEDAGFEIRDVVMHLFGQGFPKSHNVGKAIDARLGADRSDNGATITAPATDAARTWEGWGTALKPAAEHWILARKPLEGTVAENVLAHGVGALNIEGCRIAFQGAGDAASAKPGGRSTSKVAGATTTPDAGRNVARTEFVPTVATGRFPANVTLDEEAAAMLDAQSGVLTSGAHKPCVRANRNGYAGPMPAVQTFTGPASSGGASRFFYVAKAPKRDKTAGGEVENTHPTVKNTELMRWLCRLITPPGGVVLDPFMGSGSTGIAAWQEGFGFVGVEAEQNYYDIAFRRFELLLWNAGEEQAP